MTQLIATGTLEAIARIIVGLSLASMVFLIACWIAVGVEERDIKRRREARERENESAYPTVVPAEWNYPAKWSPTHAEAHLGKTTLGRNGRDA